MSALLFGRLHPESEPQVGDELELVVPDLLIFRQRVEAFPVACPN